MKKYLWIVLACLVVFFGCNLLNREFYRANDDYFGDPTKGAVDLVVNGGSVPNKTLSANMNLVNYRFHFMRFTDGTPPDLAEEFYVTIGAGPTGNLTHTQVGLTPATDPDFWRVTIEALNNESPQQVIGGIDGSAATVKQFEIRAGEKSPPVDVTVEPIFEDGYGDLRIFVSWPDAAGSNEDLTATLELDPTAGGFRSGFTVTANNDPPVGTRTAEFDSRTNGQGPMDVGYYMMTLKLEDGSTLLWGYMEAVRIVDHLLADSYDPVADLEKFALTLSGSGSVELPIDPVMNNPVEIAFSPPVPDPPLTLVAGENHIVTATLTLPTPASYKYEWEWYLDGTPTGVTGSQVGPTSPFVVPDVYDIVADAFITANNTGKHNLGLLVTGRNNTDVMETQSSENFPFIIQ